MSILGEGEADGDLTPVVLVVVTVGKGPQAP